MKTIRTHERWPLDISVVIVSYNTKDVLRKALTALLTSVRLQRVEVIVVDNGSTDSSTTIIQEHFPQVKLISNHGNRYYTGANNQGLKQARGKYLLIMNPDVIVAPDTVKVLKDFMDSRPGAGAVGCVQRPNPETSVGIGGVCWKLRNPLSGLTVPPAPILNRILPPTMRPSRKYLEWDKMPTLNPRQYSVDVLSGSFIMLRREALETAGLFDERLRLFYTDDDLCHRILRAGWKNYLTDSTYVTHMRGTSTWKMSGPLSWAIWTCDRMRYFSKYYGLPIGLFVGISKILIDILTLIQEKQFGKLVKAAFVR